MTTMLLLQGNGPEPPEDPDYKGGLEAYGRDQKTTTRDQIHLLPVFIVLSVKNGFDVLSGGKKLKEYFMMHENYKKFKFWCP